MKLTCLTALRRNVAYALLRAASRLLSMPVPGDPR
jgi:hypothetical protein